jgi:16S rRNA (uracil1498-N3)-methyltransferase
VQLVVDDLSPDVLSLEGSEARHLVRVLRARVGEEYLATDGRGARAEVVVRGFGRASAELEVVARRSEPPPARRLWVATACDAPRMEWLCEKAAELGAWGLLPIATGRGGQRVDRLRRVARAALGQALGAYSLQVSAPAPLETILAGPPGGPPWQGRVWADPGGSPIAAVQGRELAGAGDLLLVAGPPFGFSTAERASLVASGGPIRVDLGPQRLRSETAALALLAWFALSREIPSEKGDSGAGRG